MIGYGLSQTDMAVPTEMCRSWRSRRLTVACVAAEGAVSTMVPGCVAGVVLSRCHIRHRPDDVYVNHYLPTACYTLIHSGSHIHIHV